MGGEVEMKILILKEYLCKVVFCILYVGVGVEWFFYKVFISDYCIFCFDVFGLFYLCICIFSYISLFI